MIRHLLIKSQKGQPLAIRERLELNLDGIIGNIPCLPLRQVLIIPSLTLDKFSLDLGDLRENIVVDFDQLHDLPSGQVIQVGSATIQLTFHCEPCRVIAPKVNIKSIQHQRGYLAKILKEGVVNVGDSFIIMTEVGEKIPYDLKERLAWYLTKQDKSVTTDILLRDIGLSQTYARALPSLLRHIPGFLSDKVIFKTKDMSQSKTLALDFE